MAVLMFVWGLLGLVYVIPPRSWPALFVLGLPLLLSGAFFSVRSALSHARVTRTAVVYVGYTRTRRTPLDQIGRALVVEGGGSADEFWDLLRVRAVQPLLELHDGAEHDLPALGGLARSNRPNRRLERFCAQVNTAAAATHRPSTDV